MTPFPHTTEYQSGCLTKNDKKRGMKIWNDDEKPNEEQWMKKQNQSDLAVIMNFGLFLTGNVILQDLTPFMLDPVHAQYSRLQFYGTQI